MRTADHEAGTKDQRVRPAAHAGRFYPDDPVELKRQVTGFIAEGRAVVRAAGGADPGAEGKTAKALIAPHAGYMYSGPVAGSAYACLEGNAAAIRRVVLIGPAHYAAFPGVAVSGMDAYATPLGLVPVDRDWVEKAIEEAGVERADAPHAPEHSLEVHLPFLQVLLGRFSLVPLAVGQAEDAAVGRLLEALWGGPETCIVVSSDLSHFHGYDTARALDAATAKAILGLEGQDLAGEDACGYEGVRGLLWVARRRGMRCRLLDLRNSGDTSGSRHRVVGYGAFALA
jgi:AmmeMemoRadiSam system protein B